MFNLALGLAGTGLRIFSALSLFVFLKPLFDSGKEVSTTFGQR
jgi:hypothetical protein